MSEASTSVSCRNRRLRQITGLRDTDKSRHFALTVFNNYFVIRSPSLFFKQNNFGKRRHLPFSHKSDHNIRRAWFQLCMSRILFAAKHKKKHKIDCNAHEQTIICRQLLAGYIVRSRLAKRNKNLHRMTMNKIRLHSADGCVRYYTEPSQNYR